MLGNRSHHILVLSPTWFSTLVKFQGKLRCGKMLLKSTRCVLCFRSLFQHLNQNTEPSLTLSALNDDSKPTFKYHIRNVTGKLLQNIVFLFRNKISFPSICRKRIVESTFLTILDYGDVKRNILQIRSVSTFWDLPNGSFHISS